MFWEKRCRGVTFKKHKHLQLSKRYSVCSMFLCTRKFFELIYINLYIIYIPISFVIFRKFITCHTRGNIINTYFLINVSDTFVMSILTYWNKQLPKLLYSFSDNFICTNLDREKREINNDLLWQRKNIFGVACHSKLKNLLIRKYNVLPFFLSPIIRIYFRQITRPSFIGII